MAVGNLYIQYINCLRYSRADYLRKLVRPFENHRQSQIYSPFRRWTCGRIINTYPRFINQLSTCFHPLPLGREWVGFRCCRGVVWDVSASTSTNYLRARSCRQLYLLLLIYKGLSIASCVSILRPWSPNKIVRCLVLWLDHLQINLFHHTPLFASWLFICCSILLLYCERAVHTFIYLNVKKYNS
jgi:hypothetical protein